MKQLLKSYEYIEGVGHFNFCSRSLCIILNPGNGGLKSCSRNLGHMTEIAAVSSVLR